jgi:hypothetical protein
VFTFTASLAAASSSTSSSLADGLIGALIGAVIGGAATFAASWWQTRRVLDHERGLARSAAEEERRAARAAVTRTAARDLLEALFLFDAALPKLHHASIARRPDAAEIDNSGHLGADAALEALRHGELVGAPLAGGALAERWGHLRALAIEYAVEVGTLPEAWPLEVISRAEVDLRAYAEYVRLTLQALIDGREPPADSPPPVLGRRDGAAWNPDYYPR